MNKQTFCCFDSTVCFFFICYDIILKLVKILLHQKLMRILRLQSTISSFKLRLISLSVYKSCIFSFQANWNWESGFCFNHHVIIFCNFLEENIIFLKFIHLFISSLLHVFKCLTQWIMTCFDVFLSHSQKQSEKKKFDIFFYARMLLILSYLITVEL